MNENENENDPRPMPKHLPYELWYQQEFINRRSADDFEGTFA